jgi:acyl-coenzyme A thioesterase PaaI-like protein
MLTATGPEVRAVFHVGRALCGHRGIVHGGLTAALMDDVSGAATFVAAGGGHFTANLTINYVSAVRSARMR